MHNAAIVALLATALVGGFHASQADADDACTRSIVANGSGLFLREAVVAERCAELGLQRELQRDCPDSEQLNALEAAEIADVDRVCRAPKPGTNVCISRVGELGLDLVLQAYGSLPPDPEPDAGIRRCRTVFGRAIGIAAKARSESLKRCIRGAILGKPGFGPPDASCDEPTHMTDQRSTKVNTQQTAKIRRACANLSPGSDLGLDATCGTPPCDFPLDGADALASCGVCLATQAADTALTDLAKLPLEANDGCALVFGRALMTLADAVERILAGCRNQQLSTARLCPDQNTLTRIASVVDLASRRIASSCKTVATPATSFQCPGTCAAITVADEASLLECTHCAVDAVVATATTVVDVAYTGHALPQGALRTCRVAIGDNIARRASSLGVRALHVLSDCETDRACSRDTATICPTAADLSRIARSATSVRATITKRCAAVDPQDLGFGPVCTGGARGVLPLCGAIPTEDLNGLLDCLVCVAESAGQTVFDGAFPR